MIVRFNNAVSFGTGKGVQATSAKVGTRPDGLTVEGIEMTATYVDVRWRDAGGVGVTRVYGEGVREVMQVTGAAIDAPSPFRALSSASQRRVAEAVERGATMEEAIAAETGMVGELVARDSSGEPVAPNARGRGNYRQRKGETAEEFAARMALPRS